MHWFLLVAAIRIFANLAYAPDATPAHQLDLYLPAQAANAPLVLFVHGGAFMVGDRRDNGELGRSFARQGIAVAVVSYRLFPATDALGSTQDVAQAVSWMLAHARDYGVSARTIFLAGHSAGGQIVSLLGTDSSLLAREGVSFKQICGVLADAGAYDLRNLSDEPDSWQRVDGHIYGESPSDRARVSPSLFVSAQDPPFIVACGTRDDPDACTRAVFFMRRLRAAGDTSSFVVRENGADHMGMLQALYDESDPLNGIVRSYLTEHCQND